MGLPTFFGLNTAVNALQAMQQAQSVVSNNIANANTPGYVRETANLVELNPYPPAGDTVLAGQVGQGSGVNTVARQTNAFVNQQDRLNQGTQQKYQTLNQNLVQIEGILNEPSSTSMQNALDQFFQSWQALSTDPTSTAARQAVIAQSQSLTQTFQTVTTQLVQLQQGMAQTVSGQLGQLNTYAQQVYDLNQQIVQIEKFGQQSTGTQGPVESPNTLLDQRGLILDKMSQLANISYSAQSDGSVNVYLGQGQNRVPLVDTTQNYPLNPTLLLPASNQYVGSSAALPPGQTIQTSQVYLSNFTSGAIAGNVQSLDNTSQLLANLDSFLQGFASQVNGIQQAGSDLSSNPPPPPALFDISTNTADPAVTAGNVVLSVDQSFLGQNGTDYIAAAASGAPPGDNSNALKMVNLQNQTFGPNGPAVNYNVLTSATMSSASYTGSGTFDQFLSSQVANIGTEAAAAQSGGQTANALAQQSANLRQSISGVNTDEEATKMIEFQNAYNAAAKFISVFDQMLQTLINAV